jgi:hypothetical protein
MSADEPGGVREPWSGQTGWHVARWGAWGWTETAIKLVAILVAVRAAGAGGSWSLPGEHRLAFWCLLGVGAGYVVAIADRWIDREIVAMVFVLAMVAGHGALVHAMGGADWPAGPVRTFAGLMLLGDLVKIATFVRTGARVRKLPRPVPIVMTGVLASIYLVALLAA